MVVGLAFYSKHHPTHAIESIALNLLRTGRVLTLVGSSSTLENEIADSWNSLTDTPQLPTRISL